MLAYSFEVTATTTRASLASLIAGLSLTIANDKRFGITLKVHDGSATAQTGIVAVGGSAVTLTGTAATNGEPLEANESRYFDDATTGTIYLIASASTKVRVTLENFRS